MKVRSKVHVLEKSVLDCRREIQQEQQRLDEFLAERHRIDEARSVYGSMLCA